MVAGSTMYDCGSSNLKVEIMQGDRFCVTEESGDFYLGSTVEWTNEALGSCKNFQFLENNEPIYHRFRLNNMDDFCPYHFFITLDDKSSTVYAAPTPKKEYFFITTSDYIGQKTEMKESDPPTKQA